MKKNLEIIREKIISAAKRAGRNPDAVTLIGAAKGVDCERIREAYHAGLLNVGENYLQEAKVKIPQCPENIIWHFIGHLQKNKVNPAVSLFSMIHSVDSIELLIRISRRGEIAGRIVPVLLEVNIGGENTKFGLSPEDVPALLSKAGKLNGAKVAGLMCMPPYTEDPEDSRPYFKKMASLFHRLNREGFPAWNGKHLSMGMSGDFEVAVEEGATMVRVGRGIFGERK